MGDINWRAADVMKAMLDLISAIEKQDVNATLEITANVKRPRRDPQYIGSFFGENRIYERRV